MTVLRTLLYMEEYTPDTGVLLVGLDDILTLNTDLGSRRIVALLKFTHEIAHRYIRRIHLFRHNYNYLKQFLQSCISTLLHSKQFRAR